MTNPMYALHLDNGDIVAYGDIIRSLMGRILTPRTLKTYIPGRKFKEIDSTHVRKRHVFLCAITSGEGFGQENLAEYGWVKSTFGGQSVHWLKPLQTNRFISGSVAAIGNDCHFCVVRTDGIIFHSILYIKKKVNLYGRPFYTWRHPQSQEIHWENVNAEIGCLDYQFKSVSCAAVGETLQVIALRNDSKIVHTTRYSDGSWKKINQPSSLPNILPEPLPSGTSVTSIVAEGGEDDNLNTLEVLVLTKNPKEDEFWYAKYDPEPKTWYSTSVSSWVAGIDEADNIRLDETIKTLPSGTQDLINNKGLRPLIKEGKIKLALKALSRV